MAKTITLRARDIENGGARIGFAAPSPALPTLRHRFRLTFGIKVSRDDGGPDESKNIAAALDADGRVSSPVLVAGDGPLTDEERDALWNALRKLFLAAVAREGLD